MLKLSTAQPARHPSPTARVVELSYVIFERPDLDRTEQFLTEFGLLRAKRTPDTLFMRGYLQNPYCYRVHQGPEPRFVGAGFKVGSAEELRKLAQLPGATPIVAAPYPGGGELLCLRDPSGFSVEISHGQRPVVTVGTRRRIELDDPNRFNHPQRPPVDAPEVLRLGHVVLEASDYQATCAFYTEHLGLIPSDVQLLPDGSPAVTFLRCDLGDAPADHHTLALAQGIMPELGHVAFELLDTDAVGMGNRMLRERGYQHAWGIGRHILGSQIFDYWYDDWGGKHEHYCDGDRFTADVAMGVHPVSREAMAQWGEPMPSSFTRPRLSARTIAGVTASLRRSPDLTFAKLRKLAKIFA